MVSTNDIRPGQSIIVDGSILLILEYQCSYVYRRK